MLIATSESGEKLEYIRKVIKILDSRQIKKLFLLQILVVFSSLVEVLGVASVAPFMAVVVDKDMTTKNAFLKAVYTLMHFNSREKFLVAFGGAVFGVILLGNIFILVTNWCMNYFGNQVGRSISVNLFKSYLERPYLFHTENNSSNLTKNIFQEVIRVTNNVILQLLTLNSKIVTIIFIVGALFYVNFKITLISSLFLGGSYVLVYYFIRKKIFNNGKELSKLSGKGFQVVSEGLGGIKEVKLFGKEEIYITAFDSNMNSIAELNTQNAVIPLVPRYFLEIIAFGGIVISIIVLLQNGNQLVDFLPTLSLFALAGLRLIPALQQAFYAVALIKSNVYSFDIVYEDIVGSKNSSQDKKKFELEVNRRIEFKNEIQIKDLVFKFPNATCLTIDHLSLNIEAGKSIALVGPSGSGKSTLVDLVLGLLTPEAGQIIVDGVTLDKDNLRMWQNKIGYVPQNVYLQDATFMENIAFGVPVNEIDLEKVKESAKLARLDQFILSKPEGFNTFVGERGIQLSGGQRQRIGIARALYNKASILVFDEATSALDSITENEIMDSINELVGERTIIMIAHRLSTVRECHKIYIMDRGHISDHGTYIELIEKNDLFKNLAKIK